MQDVAAAQVLPDLEFGYPSTCTYCGEPATTTDHVFCVASQTIRRNTGRKFGFGPVTYACHQCNCRFLGSKMFDHFEARCAHVQALLHIRAKPILWRPSEIKRLSCELQDYVLRDRNCRILYRYRADWYESPSFLYNIENLLWTDIFTRRHPSYSPVLHAYFAPTIARLREMYH